VELSGDGAASVRPAAPAFSIVIPTFQRRDVVTEAVRALCKLEYSGPVELIVVIDGSTDGTAGALAALECPFSLRIVEQANAGAAAARNRGAAEASGEILLFVDDDMICQPDILQQHARSHAKGADAVLGDIPLDSASPPGFLSRSVASWANSRSQRLRDGAPLGVFDLLTGQISIRRDLFEALGGFDPQFTSQGSFGNEDLDLGTRLLESHTVIFNPDAVSHQRYLVTPRQHLRQWFDAGRADVAFARKHPGRARELFAFHGSARLVTRLLVRPLAALPGAPRAIGAISATLAEREVAAGEVFERLQTHLFFFARQVVYWSGVRSAGGIPTSKKALVLCYHAIADLRDDPLLADYGIPPDRFRSQLDRLIARGFTFIGADELRACLSGRGALPRRAVLLSFDDCYAELAHVARDLLRPRGIAAIAFAVTGLTSNEWDVPLGARRLPLLDHEGLRELHRNGIEIGCHSRSHLQLPQLDDAELAAETGGAAGDLERAGLPRPRAFAYPYGLYDARSAAAVDEAGFDMAFGLARGRAGHESAALALPRVEILARDHGWRFRLKTAFPRLSAALPI
jgi:glycosyltransferase involved in cell wall biosynthesis/peptidoglycan/xylan/chitin deacetylase (PgdA/CDA1 family)